MRMVITAVVDLSGGSTIIGAKERMAMDLERYGDVRVVSVREERAESGEQLGLFPAPAGGRR